MTTNLFLCHCPPRRPTLPSGGGLFLAVRAGIGVMPFPNYLVTLQPESKKTPIMSPVITTIILLIVSNIFMTVAWYGHLKLQATGISSSWPLFVVILFSWGVALLEYCFQVPANRIGFEGNGGPFSLIQLKVTQEVITLIVFCIFSLIAFENFHLRWNHAVAFLCLVAAVYFTFLPEHSPA